nr:MAG TPA: hypothetical protein [Caudoviricetes sp.]
MPLCLLCETSNAMVPLFALPFSFSYNNGIMSLWMPEE